MNKEWEQLIDIIAGNTGWGPVSQWQGGDFRKLGQLIFDKTRVSISESTLRRLFGKSEYPHVPNETTLDTLAVFAGYPGWREFRSRQNHKPGRKSVITKKVVLAISVAAGLLAIGALFYRFAGKWATAGGRYDFTSKPVTRTIPNSVIFHYKAPSQTGPLYIQQSWDVKTRAKVDPGGDTYTSVYYRPGFFEAKLIAGDRVVKEHALVIPTSGWLGLIYCEPSPYYLKPGEFTRPDRYEVAEPAFAARGLKPEQDLLRAELYNVGNFEPIPVADADFTAMVKTDSSSTGNACKRMQIFLITNGVPISLMIGDKGCVSTFAFFNGKTLVSGKTADLSDFGIIPGSWVKTEIKSVTGKLQYLVNGHIAYETSLPAASMKVLGIAFGFDNGGAAKSIKLRDKDNIIFQDK